MVGKLTKWLKLLGYPAKVAPHPLLELPERDEMWRKFENSIITRSQDPQLQKLYPKAKIIVIVADQLEKQLAQLYQHDIIDFEYQNRSFYCTSCSSVKPLQEIADKENYKEEIPAASYEHYETFYRCLDCGKIFWKGTHWEDIDRKLERIASNVNKKK